MKKDDVPAVPALSEAAIARIEREVFTTLDREQAQGAGAARAGAGLWPRRARGRRLAWAGIATATVAAAAAVAFVVGGRALRDGGGGLPARGARIATATSPSHLTIPGASVDVAPSSAIDFATEHDGTIAIRLERGAVTCEVAPRAHRAPFIVEAGATRVTVVGTRFTVRRMGDHAAVSVEHGTVEVGDGGLTQLVHAGERYQPAEREGPGEVAAPAAGAAATPQAPEATTVKDTAESAAMAAPTAAPAAVTERVAPQPPRAPTPARVVAKPRRRRVTLALAAPDARPTATATAHLTPEPSSSEPERTPAPAPSAATSPNASPSPSPPATAPPPTPVEAPRPPAVPAPAPALASAPVVTAASRFAEATNLEARDPERALGIYRELAAREGAWAANALFAEARLEIEHRRTRGRALLDEYLRRFPRGANADDARALAARLDRAGRARE